MIKKVTCIECPKGCILSVSVKNSKVINIRDNECPKGEKHVVAEIENPCRTFTSTVLARGLSLKMVPVKTDQPIQKSLILKAAQEVRKIRISMAVQVGDIIVKNFLSAGANLIATSAAEAT